MFLAGHRYAGDEDSGWDGDGQDSTLFAMLGWRWCRLWNHQRDENGAERMSGCRRRPSRDGIGNR
ncbi:hypothetical protein CBI38_32445 (plasmid) [Rhodococcus oxybenzonivorans]|uniref:Uncharacterized protein n=1 Tax=Rhodococcus oxybenzonivorans TaxID=1990687 RepID=A0A2S2C5T6_9NOCA|nr:hypothetical protein CBI38_32445 [Rhodococcus oxybenzonivorans]